jgi:U3 small nucleolar RNA-associated protein 12
VIVSLALSPDERYVAVGFMSGTVGTYDTSLSGPMMSFQAHNSCLRSLAISPSGIIATASEDTRVELWTCVVVFSGRRTLQQEADFVMTVAFAANDPIVFTGSQEGTIRCWSQDRGQQLFVLTGDRETIFQVDTHPTERVFVTCGADGLVCVWQYVYA